MPFNRDAKYPGRRTYFVKVQGESKPGALAGRVENLVTGQRHVFESGQELIDSIATDLRTSDAKEPPNSAGTSASET